MNIFKRLFAKPSGPIECPRCLGKGYVDESDIIRLGQASRWKPGSCAYCNGTGKVDPDMIDKVAPNDRRLTNNLSPEERNKLFNQDKVVRDRKLSKCPIPEERRQWLEYAFGWLVDAFGEDSILQRRVLVPHHSDFPIRYNGDEQTARGTLSIVARQMEINPDEIELFFYQDGIREISAGDMGSTIYTTGEGKDGVKSSSGRYMGRQEDGKFHIALKESILREPEYLIATLAHELSHIKLLGEERLLENDEQLTDLNTIVFGLGIFNANAAFASFQDFRSHGWRKLGYLTQMDWGYTLALFARLRGENDPDWAKHLCKNIKSDFAKSYRYLESVP